MDILGTAVTGLITLAAVALGGWLTIRTQRRSWSLERERQWRDIRLTAYGDFIESARAHLALVLDDSSTIRALPHPRRTGELMPVFDERRRPIRERLEGAKTRARIVAGSTETLTSMAEMTQCLRAIAADRASKSTSELAQANFDQFFRWQADFIEAARRELHLPDLPIRLEPSLYPAS